MLISIRYLLNLLRFSASVDLNYLFIIILDICVLASKITDVT